MAECEILVGETKEELEVNVRAYLKVGYELASSAMPIIVNGEVTGWTITVYRTDN